MLRPVAAVWEARVGEPGQGWPQAFSRRVDAVRTLQGGGLQRRDAHCGPGGAFPQLRGSPCVGTGGGGKKSLKPRAEPRWLRKGLPAALGLGGAFRRAERLGDGRGERKVLGSAQRRRQGPRTEVQVVTREPGRPSRPSGGFA